MKVALIFTGGTIGTVENDDGVRNLDNKNNSSTSYKYIWNNRYISI